jgi:metal-responsive CopG/Arc/MetJ family transcriptional regulator
MSRTVNSTDEQAPMIGLRLPASLLERLDGWSSLQGCVSRSEAVRRLIADGIDRFERGRAKVLGAN